MNFLFLTSFFEWIDKADKKLFLKINTQWTNHFFDTNLPWYREASTWIPLYIFLLLFVIIYYGKKSIPWIIVVIATAALSDQISSNLLKNIIERPRPCNDVFIHEMGRLLIGRCPTSFSLPSSHAVNHFAAAIFIFITLKPAFKKWAYLFIFWAASICYAQVYVGVHYPVDVLVGAIIGSLIGGGVAFLFNKYFKLEKNKS